MTQREDSRRLARLNSATRFVRRRLQRHPRRLSGSRANLARPTARIRRSPMILRPLALALLLAAAAPAQFIYGLNIHGKLTLNGTVLDSLPSAFDPQQGANTLERWWELGIHGPDRIAMRLDGRVQKNGAKLFELPVAIGSSAIFAWVSLAVDSNGGVHMLRQDGERALDGTAAVIYPLGSSF